MPDIRKIVTILLYQAFFISGFGQNLNEKTNISFYHITLNTNNSNTYISGNCNILLENIQSNAHVLLFELTSNFTIDSILINGFHTSFLHRNDSIYVNNVFLELNQLYAVTIFYKGTGSSIGGRGIMNVTAENNQKITYTLCEPFFSKYWFPVKQDLNDKIDSLTVTLITPSGVKGISNGLLKSTIQNSDGTMEYTWVSHYPIAYYLISITVSDYQEYSYYHRFENGDSMLISNYLYKSPQYLIDHKDKMDRTGELLDLFGSMFGPYPFKNEKYGHVLAPIGGGMEHQTITLIASFDFDLVAHELAHQWWGNLVTCSAWNDIWINEGFASYSEYLANEFLISEQSAELWLTKKVTNALSLNEGSVFVDDITDSKRIFDGRLTYDKGAVIIHQLRNYIDNDDLFFASLKTFLNDFAFKNASGDDFRKTVEQVTGLDLYPFFNQWYYSEGHPEFNVTWHQTDNQLFLTIDKNKNADLLLPFRITFFNGPDSIIVIDSDKLQITDTLFIHHTVKNLIFIDNNDQLAKLQGMTLADNSGLFGDMKIYQDIMAEKLLIYNYLDKDFTYKIYNLQGQLTIDSGIRKSYVEIYTGELGRGVNILEITTHENIVFRVKVLIH